MKHKAETISIVVCILVFVFFIVSCVGMIDPKPEVFPTATVVSSLPDEYPIGIEIEKTGSIGLHDLYEYRSDDLICLIGKECNGINCSIAISCVKKGIGD